MRDLASFVVGIVGLFCVFWSIGAVVSSDLDAWCHKLPYGIGFPVFVFAYFLAGAIPAVLTILAIGHIQIGKS